CYHTITHYYQKCFKLLLNHIPKFHWVRRSLKSPDGGVPHAHRSMDKWTKNFSELSDDNLELILRQIKLSVD
ncbi:hypothetical protein L9F63_025730, partial [Diploptera punctata]